MYATVRSFRSSFNIECAIGLGNLCMIKQPEAMSISVRRTPLVDDSAQYLNGAELSAEAYGRTYAQSTLSGG